MLVASVIGLLAAALLLGLIAERLRLPYIVVLTVASVPLYVPGLRLAFGPALLVLFLPALVFEAAWNLDHRALARTWRAIALLAIPGVVVTAGVVGLGLMLARQLPLPSALLLGVILAATDPVAVIATFRRLATPLDLSTIVEAESLFNDGTAVVLYSLAVAAFGSAGTAPGVTPSILLTSAGSAAGGLAVGACVAFFAGRAMRIATDPLLQIVATIVAAYGAYLAADALHVSGIFATIGTGIALRAGERVSRSDIDGVEIDRFWSVAAFIANSLLFLVVGLRIEVPRIWHEPALVLSTLGLLVAARLVLAYTVLPLARVRGAQPAWRHVIALAGIRGALSLALALGLPPTVPMRAQIVDAVFAVVAATLIVQGIAIGPLIARMRLAPQA